MVESVGIIILNNIFELLSLLLAVVRGSTGVGSEPDPLKNLTQVEGDHRHEMNAIFNSSSKIDHLRYNKAQFI